MQVMHFLEDVSAVTEFKKNQSMAGMHRKSARIFRVWLKNVLVNVSCREVLAM